LGSARKGDVKGGQSQKTIFEGAMPSLIEQCKQHPSLDYLIFKTRK
jgi:hypothetical protein